MMLKFRMGICNDGTFGVALEECPDKYDGGKDKIRRANMDLRIAGIFRENMKSILCDRSALCWVGAIATWRTVRRIDGDCGTCRLDYSEKPSVDLAFLRQARRVHEYLKDPENNGKANDARTKAEV